ncbi:MAG: hypothetical protein NZT61_03775 [Deltaproteobacteria bacterium]|nr:hypothetical protein [Deltaproteobacteria bacterium]MCX7952261.1 hypothetical protein [Deltaproteobacteria bacterium]
MQKVFQQKFVKLCGSGVLAALLWTCSLQIVRHFNFGSAVRPSTSQASRVSPDYDGHLPKAGQKLKTLGFSYSEYKTTERQLLAFCSKKFRTAKEFLNDFKSLEASLNPDVVSSLMTVELNNQNPNNVRLEILMGHNNQAELWQSSKNNAIETELSLKQYRFRLLSNALLERKASSANYKIFLLGILSLDSSKPDWLIELEKLAKYLGISPTDICKKNLDTADPLPIGNVIRDIQNRSLASIEYFVNSSYDVYAPFDVVLAVKIVYFLSLSNSPDIPTASQVINWIDKVVNSDTSRSARSDTWLALLKEHSREML